MNNTQTLSLTVGIDYAETAKSIMAELAIITACRPPEERTIPLANCRIKELIATKTEAACDSVGASLSGYISDVKPEDDTFLIELQLPHRISHTAQRTIAARMEETIILTVLADLLSGSAWLNDELDKCQSRRAKALSSLRQLLAPH